MFLVLRLSLQDGKSSFAVQEITLTKLFYYFKGKKITVQQITVKRHFESRNRMKRILSFFFFFFCSFGFMTLSRLFYLV